MRINEKGQMNKMKTEIKMKKLKEENKELKRILSIYLNKPLLRRLNKSLKQIEKGEYISEEKFFKNYPQLTA